ncbi:MAG TPA: class I tRNA ligase family protein [Streptosporangiaceae bacterium]|nr:class I tRNA ligase family protein [Streptosporangiaceae bacterium]
MINPMAAAGGEPGPEPVLTLGGATLPLPGRARIYACGITPYDVTHLGHAATFVWVDTLARVLRSAATDVILCRNVTDVDDVLLAAANRAGSPYDRYAAIQQFYFDRDMSALGVTEPALQPRAHAFIGQVIALASGLLARGAAYERDGSVYFSGAATARQAGVDRETALRLSAEYGDRPDDPAKDDPFDIVLWHAAGQGEAGSQGEAGGQGEAAVDAVAWPSPWGPGRPGWHAECAAMALHAFGPAIDVHAGGADLRFPHHAYQAALAEQFTGVRPFARAHLNVGVVTVSGAKMAKSTGNLVLVSDVLESHSAAAVRLLILDRPWGQEWDYDPAALAAAARRLELLQIAAGRPENSATAVAAVRGALADDLNVPAALAIAEEAGGQAARVLGSLLGLW